MMLQASEASFVCLNTSLSVDYGAGQQLGKTSRNEGSNCIAYDSVRNICGECRAVFRPRLLSNCLQERHLCYF